MLDVTTSDKAPYESCIALITKAYSQLSPAEQKVADYILAHLDEVLYYSIRELGEKVSVSEATIVRFCQALGFSGFQRFKIGMAKRMSREDSLFLNMDIASSGLNAAVMKALEADMQAIKDTLSNLDFDGLARAVNVIAKCNRLYFFGVGTSGIVGLDAQLKFSRLNLPVWAYVDPHSAAAAAALLGNKDVMIGISHSGDTRDVVKVLRISKGCGAITIGITSNPHSLISDVCTIILRTATREVPFHAVALTSRISQHAMIDALFVGVMSEKYPEAKSWFERALDSTANLLE